MKSRGTLVVVDDDASILELLRMILEDEGYEVRAFGSPRAAVKDVLASPPEAVIVDMMMPGMTGLDVVDTLRADRRTSRLPVLVCSAFYGDLRRMIRRDGLDGVRYLRKPFQIDELLQLVNAMLSSRQEVGARSSGSSNRRSQRMAALGSHFLY